MVVTVALASRHLPIEVLLETRENVAYLFRSSINAARPVRIYRSERRARTLGRAEVRVGDDSFIWSAYAVGGGLFIDNCDAALALTKLGISVEAPNSLLSIPPPSVELYLPGTLYGQK